MSGSGPAKCHMIATMAEIDSGGVRGWNSCKLKNLFNSTIYAEKGALRPN